jgi:hypothetical protein
MWRSEHLGTFCTAELARQPFISGAPAPARYYNNETWEEVRAAAFAKAIKSEEEPARERYGERYELLALGKVVTIPYLKRELELQQLLSEMIDKCIKRLLLARGLKSISAASNSGPVQRLSAPPKAA